MSFNKNNFNILFIVTKYYTFLTADKAEKTVSKLDTIKDVANASYQKKLKLVTLIQIIWTPFMLW